VLLNNGSDLIPYGVVSVFKRAGGNAVDWPECSQVFKRADLAVIRLLWNLLDVMRHVGESKRGLRLVDVRDVNDALLVVEPAH